MSTDRTPGRSSERSSRAGSSGGDPLLEVRNLHTQFDTEEGVVRAVDGVDFHIERGETVCIVGESGSGKTVTSESITKIIDMPPGKIPEGEVLFDGQDLAKMSDQELKRYRGNRIAHIFQNPQGALNPVYTVGWQIREAIQLHDQDVSKEEARERTVELLDRVGIPEPSSRLDDYPHEFSGGMKQRVVIAMALAAEPDLLIADEPTTALDVTIQAQILRLLRDLQEEFGMSILLITHDLGVVAEMADRVIVMYAGKVMEVGDVYSIFENPAHPYTLALLDCLPGEGEVTTIEGSLPKPIDPPDGCRFHARCPAAVAECRDGDQPPLLEADDGNEDHVVSCVHYGPGKDPSVVDRAHERRDARGTGGGAGESGGAGYTDGGERR